MGSNSSRRSGEPEYLRELIEVSQKEFQKYQTEKDEASKRQRKN